MHCPRTWYRIGDAWYVTNVECSLFLYLHYSNIHILTFGLDIHLLSKYQRRKVNVLFSSLLFRVYFDGYAIAVGKQRVYKKPFTFYILGCIRISLSGNNIFQTEHKYKTRIYYCLFISIDITIYSLASALIVFSSKIILSTFYVIQRLLHPIGKVI